MSQCLGGECDATLTAGSKYEVLGISVAHSVNHINLLQCVSNRIFILSGTRNICSPELQDKNRHVWVYMLALICVQSYRVLVKYLEFSLPHTLKNPLLSTHYFSVILYL